MSAEPLMQQAVPEQNASGTGAADAPQNTQVVTPWDVSGGTDGKIDYDKLTREFGVAAIDDNLIQRVERLTGKAAHPFLKRHIFFAHRDLKEILDCYERKIPFYLYTGRGPSSEALHLGHLIPFMFTQYLQEAFQVPLVIQLTDDEKALWRGLDIKESQRLARENCKDIIACGFDVNRTFIFSDFGYMGNGGGGFYENIVSIQRAVTMNQVKGIFGFNMESNIGKIAFPAVQAAPSFPTSFPHMFGQRRDIRCLIPCAIDQDPYFRMTRIVCASSPCLPLFVTSSRARSFQPIRSTTLCTEKQWQVAMQGESGKMSASDTTSAIFTNDTPKQIKDKVNRYAFSGGGATIAEHREKGCNLAVDVTWKYLNFFMSDDKKLKQIENEYGSGRMLVGEAKAVLIKILQDIVAQHQEARALVTDSVVDAFMAVRPMQAACLPPSGP